MFKISGTNTSASSAKDLDIVFEDILDTLLISITIVSLFPLAASLFRATEIGWRIIMSVQVTSYLVFFATTIFRRKLHFLFKSLIIISFAFLIGLTSIYNMGMMGSGLIFMFFSLIFTTMFLGVRFAVALVVISLVLLMMIAFGVDHGWVVFPVAELFDDYSCFDRCAIPNVQIQGRKQDDQAGGQG